MSYELTKKQNLLQKNIRTLARQKFKPLADENDRSSDFPYKAIDELAKNRLLGLLVPREEGGEGAGFLDVCLVLEGISKACPVSARLHDVALRRRPMHENGVVTSRRRCAPRR